MANLNNQGKRKDQYETNARTAFYGWCGVVGMIVLLVAMTLFGGCSTTKKVDECCKTEKTSAK